MRSTVAADTLIAGIDLAGTVNAEMARVGVGQAATLLKRTPRQPASGNTAGPTRSTGVDIPCRGLREESSEPGATTVTVYLFGASIVYEGRRIIPASGDAVTIRGETFQIEAVPEDDPAAAVYTCRCATVGPGSR